MTEITDKQKSLDWWNSLPLQNIYDCRNGWANLVMIYYPYKNDCQDVSEEEILYMWKEERINNPFMFREDGTFIVELLKCIP